MKKVLIALLMFCLLLPGCMSNGQPAESESSALSIDPTESEAQTDETTAQIADITDVIQRYFKALENDDTQALAELTNYRIALFGYEKGEDGGWTCPIKSYGNAIAYNLKIEYSASHEATGWYSASESYNVTYEIDKDNREYQNYLKNDPALFDMYFTQETDDIYNLLDNGRYATWKHIGVMKDETTGNWVISGFGTGG